MNNEDGKFPPGGQFPGDTNTSESRHQPVEYNNDQTVPRGGGGGGYAAPGNGGGGHHTMSDDAPLPATTTSSSSIPTSSSSYPHHNNEYNSTTTTTTTTSSLNTSGTSSSSNHVGDGGSPVKSQPDNNSSNNCDRSDDQSDPGSPPPSDATMQAIMAFLRKNNLLDTENKLKDELKKREMTSASSSSSAAVAAPAAAAAASAADQDVGNVLAAYKSEDDPSSYESAYSDLEKFVESSLDVYRHELAMILYPVFVHMYLELVYNGHEGEAKVFLEKFGFRQESYYQEDIKKLSFVTKKEHMKGNELMDNFNTSQFTVRMSRDTYTQLRQQKKHLSEKQHTLLWNVIQEHLYLDVYEGLPRSKSQIDSTAGAIIGEANRQANRAKVYYGLPREPDVAPLPQEEEEEPEVMDGGGDKPKKKKKKENIIQKKSKNDPNAPIPTRMPFPDLRDADRIEKGRALRESLKRANLGADNIPSICMYSLMNVSCRVTSLCISDDSSMLACGMSDSSIRVWTLLMHKLRKLKPAESLKDINREAEDVLHRMMDENSGETCRELFGHSGPVYGTGFNPDKTLLVSGSEDGVVRLWSLQTWSCLVCYKGHIFPIWDVQFSPLGYYFASCSHDRTARLWATEQSQPLRIFQGHYSDVDCLAFHPNSNYVGTGSSDRSVRLWDCVTGNCVRLMTGHKAAVLSLAFSPDGRTLCSGSGDLRVLVWDIAYGHLLAELGHHSSIIASLAFSREGTILASSGIDSTIALWDFAKLMTESSLEDVNVTHNPDVRRDSSNLLLGSYRSKSSPILHLHFTRRNLLLAVGPFETSTTTQSPTKL